MLYALLLQLIGAWSKTNSEASSLTSIPMKGTSPGNPVWPQALSGEKPMRRPAFRWVPKWIERWANWRNIIYNILEIRFYATKHAISA